MIDETVAIKKVLEVLETKDRIPVTPKQNSCEMSLKILKPYITPKTFSSPSYSLNKRTAPISSNFQIPPPSSFPRLCSSTPSNFCASFVFIVVAAAASSPLAGSVCIVAGSSPLVDAAAVSSSISFCVCHRPHLPLPAPVVAASSSPHRRAPLLPPKKLLLDL
ncbi:hypothetical protein PIB30_003232 [Stylosanthes scabra]|uniref:Uncharacterized protein n=1 Tax=Stylosanthes scabra TaxID=79078 RepID=A0ABU6R3R7_9FABA|nr:hypothetical protein [Stylosanthes scabra]